MISSLLSPSAGFQSRMVYGSGERKAVICLAVASLVSLLAVVYLFVRRILPHRLTYKNTHIHGYFVSLLLANAIQSTGTVMNFRWAIKGSVVLDPFCTAQGAVKQAGNVGTALWSFVIAVHLFNILFLRWRTSKSGFVVALATGWAAVIAVVTILPIAIHQSQRGPYFGISGDWCWITSAYPRAQIFLEYFWEFVSAGVGFILYSVVLLRVRGNLICNERKWSLRWVPRGQSWQLAIGRDLIDSSMLKVAQHMVWYPVGQGIIEQYPDLTAFQVAYTIILIPITLTRLMQFSGKLVPYWATIFTDIVFNSTGFVNVMLFFSTRRFFPEMGTLPLATPRQDINVSLSKSGVTPFLLYQSETAEKYMEEQSIVTPPPRAHRSASRDDASEFGNSKIVSVDASTTLL